MTDPAVTEIVRYLEYEFYGDFAAGARYAERIAAMNGNLSARYASAARILWEKEAARLRRNQEPWSNS